MREVSRDLLRRTRERTGRSVAREDLDDLLIVTLEHLTGPFWQRLEDDRGRGRLDEESERLGRLLAPTDPSEEASEDVQHSAFGVVRLGVEVGAQLVEDAGLEERDQREVRGL